MTELKFYFYNGFREPELIAESLSEFLTNVSVTNNYLGDVTENIHEGVKELTDDRTGTLDVGGLKELLLDYGIYVNPTYTEFRKTNERWFPSDSLDIHLCSWK